MIERKMWQIVFPLAHLPGLPERSGERRFLAGVASHAAGRPTQRPHCCQPAPDPDGERQREVTLDEVRSGKEG